MSDSQKNLNDLVTDFVSDFIVIKDLDEEGRATSFRLRTDEDEQGTHVIGSRAEFLGKWRSVYMTRKCWEKSQGRER